jgi:hypothetical protein
MRRARGLFGGAMTREADRVGQVAETPPSTFIGIPVRHQLQGGEGNKVGEGTLYKSLPNPASLPFLPTFRTPGGR